MTYALTASAKWSVYQHQLTSSLTVVKLHFEQPCPPGCMFYQVPLLTFNVSNI